MNWYRKNLKQSSFQDIFKKLMPLALSLGIGASYLTFLIDKYNGNEILVKQQLIEKKEEQNKNDVPFTLKDTVPEQQTDIEQRKQDENMPTKPREGIVSLDDAIAFTIPFETYGGKYEPYAYNDTEGNKTIGYGTNIEPEAGGKRKIESIGLSYQSVFYGKQSITQNQAAKLMKQDMQVAMNDVISILPDFYSYPKEAQLILIDMMYNMGINKFSTFKNMISELKKENINWKNVAYQMKDSRWYGQVGRRSKHHVNLISRI